MAFFPSFIKKTLGERFAPSDHLTRFRRTAVARTSTNDCYSDTDQRTVMSIEWWRKGKHNQIKSYSLPYHPRFLPVVGPV